MSKEFDIAKEKESLQEIRDFYWQYIQEYAKRKDANIEGINEGIKVLMEIDSLDKRLSEQEKVKKSLSAALALRNGLDKMRVEEKERKRQQAESSPWRIRDIF